MRSPGTVVCVTADDWLQLLQQTATAIQRSLDTFDGWTEGGDRPDQYLLDQVADSAALTILNSAEATVLSEESGLVSGTTSETVIIDPVDGSTNASRRIPHYCTSLCVVDDQGPLVGLVLNLANGEQFQAVRDQGAFLDGEQIQPTQCTELNEAVIGIAGNPPKPIGARQFRAFGAAALDLCSVAAGRLDGYLDPLAHHGVWDYAAGLLICREAGAVIGELEGRELIHLEHSRRLGPAAASTPELLKQLGVVQSTDR